MQIPHKFYEISTFGLFEEYEDTAREEVMFAFVLASCFSTVFVKIVFAIATFISTVKPNLVAALANKGCCIVHELKLMLRVARVLHLAMFCRLQCC